LAHVLRTGEGVVCAAGTVLDNVDEFEAPLGNLRRTTTGAGSGPLLSFRTARRMFHHLALTRTCSSLDWLVVVAGSGGNVGETKVAAGVVAGAPST
jgi:hypothetical protein